MIWASLLANEIRVQHEGTEQQYCYEIIALVLDLIDKEALEEQAIKDLGAIMRKGKPALRKAKKEMAKALGRKENEKTKEGNIS